VVAATGIHNGAENHFTGGNERRAVTATRLITVKRLITSLDKNSTFAMYRLVITIFVLAMTYRSLTWVQLGARADPSLLERATHVSDFEPEDLEWGVLPVSRTAILYFRTSKDGKVTIRRRDFRTGFDRPLLALSRLFRNGVGYRLEVSPDGKWILWKNQVEFTETWCSTLDGTKHFKVHGGITGVTHWLPDSKRWIEFVEGPTGFSYSSAKLYDIDKPGEYKSLDMSQESPLFHKEGLPVDLDGAVFLPDNKLAVTRIGGDGDKTDVVEVNQLDVFNGGLTTEVKTFNLPHQGLRLPDIAVASSGQRLAYLLHGDRAVLGVVRPDGKENHIVGITADPPIGFANDPSRPKLDPRDLHWMPENKEIGFICGRSFYVVPVGK